MTTVSTAPQAVRNDPVHKHHLQTLYRRVWGLRALGMGLGSLAPLVVLHELKSPVAAWAWVIFVGYGWPHLAYVLAARSRDAYRAEQRNLVFDTVLAGSCVPLMHFNVLPSVVLLTMVMADRLSAGIRGLWHRGLIGMLAGVLLGGMATGFAFAPQTRMPVVLACLPILVIHTLAVSLNSYALVRRTQQQNILLKKLSRTDALTGLVNRGHWEQAATTLLATVPAGEASLLMMDLDAFKQINDDYGHLVGDDVLQAVSGVVLCHAGAGIAGRLGGDELVLAVTADAATAAAIAEDIRAGVEALRFVHAPALRCSVSIGLATNGTAGGSLRVWLDAADQALYRAKAQGRNRASAPA
ncbi:diguanylate cyclase [Aerosticca soli]|uniref:diguanylate cyclase n=1 Tax=Aerosticca soli TaxID=2010829 RepID=A0A2Z6E5E9_9GAMM|nr:diguanylate cyclase [Aerosticca soli]BBD80273.1 diguanylate cyclase [Aerosticca soli]